MKHHAPSSAPAFTLVELLVVISIIAILAGLLLPVLGRVQEGANSTKCTSNLRQIASAINAYTIDHDGRLPGPLAISQYPKAEAADAPDQQLVRKIAKYLGFSEDTSIPTPDRANVLICPSYAREIKLLNGPSFVLNPKKMTDLDQSPFGDSVGNKEPVTKAGLTAWQELDDTGAQSPVQLTRLWLMKDADQEDFKAGAAGGSPPSGVDKMPLKPVHRDHRNALFYDWHVGKLDADPDPLKKDQPK
ncbi:MAG: hypothetical protein QOE70_2405 [Chthoniobacter sp.]|jgi:prepilin-type N-terminal cleavage/methylation domain-containing protein|nr:hypothetical protein [Chthoniobacter sp.]